MLTKFIQLPPVKFSTADITTYD